MQGLWLESAEYFKTGSFGVSYVELKDNRFKIKFPFLVNPSELADNYGQVVNIAETEEKRLIRDGKLQEFNDLFRKIQDLGALDEISEAELKSWTGPV